MTPISRALFMCAAMTAVAGQAAAQDAPWTVEAYAGAVSDYRYRGLSLSGEDPALQAGVTAAHRSGFYASVDLSSIEEYGIGGDGDGAEVEATLTSGWAGSAGGVEVDVGLAWFAYPDGTDVSYFEVPVHLARTVGDTVWRTGFAYAPEQDALGDEDNRYVWGGFDYAPPHWPVKLTGSVGYEEGAYAPGGKTDWLIGIEAPVGPVSVGLAYVDSDVDEGKAVMSAFLNF